MDHTRRSSLPVCLLIGLLITAAGCGDSSPSEPGGGGNASPSVSISSPEDGATLQAGEISLTGTASDAEDGDLSAAIRWTSGSYLLGTGSAVSAILAEGSHDITASVSDSDGASGSAVVAITVIEPPNEAPVVTITFPSDSSTFTPGTSITFTATASDPEDGDLATSINWTSDLDGDIGVGPSISVTLSVGLHVVSATATDSDGKTDSATVAVAVIPADFGGEGFGIVPNATDFDISVIDLASRTVVTTVAMQGIDTISDVQVAPNGGTAYFVHPAVIDVVDVDVLATVDSLPNAVVSTIPLSIPQSSLATKMDVSPSGAFGYVCCTDQFLQNRLVVDLIQGTVVDTLEVRASARPRGMAFRTDSALAYLPSDGALIEVIDTDSHQILSTFFHDGRGFKDLEVLPGNGTAVGLRQGGAYFPQLATVDLATGTVTDSLDFGLYLESDYQSDLVLSPDGTEAWIASWGTEVVYAVDLSSRSVSSVAMPGTLPLSLTFSPDGLEVYVVSAAGPEVYVLDAESRTVVDTIGVGGGAQLIAVTGPR